MNADRRTAAPAVRRLSFPRGFNLALLCSVALHAVVIGVIVAAGSRSADSAVIAPEHVIVAKLVRLGRKRDKKLLPRLTAAPPRRAEAVAPALKPDKVDGAKRQADDDLSAAMEAALSKIKKQLKRRSGFEEEPYGSPDGSPFGTADEETEGDRYLMLVDQAIRAHWQVPSVIPDSELLYLKATLIIYIDSDGKVIRYVFEKRSGNTFFDSSLQMAVKRASPLPPPPERFRDKFRRYGLGVNFKWGG